MLRSHAKMLLSNRILASPTDRSSLVRPVDCVIHFKPHHVFLNRHGLVGLFCSQKSSLTVLLIGAEVFPTPKKLRVLPLQDILKLVELMLLHLHFFIPRMEGKLMTFARPISMVRFFSVTAEYLIPITDPASLLARRGELGTGPTGSNFLVHVFFDLIAVLGIQTYTAPMPRSTHSDQSVEHGTHYLKVTPTEIKGKWVSISKLLLFPIYFPILVISIFFGSGSCRL